jgi:nitrile hydratase accessory protein
MNLDEPVFQAPWQALAFGLTLKLHERGLFSWSEWADTLAAVIREAQAAGDPDLGDTYYEHWAKALERMMVSRGLAADSEIEMLAVRLASEAEHARELQLPGAAP